MTEPAREYGVRYWYTGTKPDILLCDHPDDVRTAIEDLHADGFVNVEPVTRLIADWDIDVDQLPAEIRALAESHVDGEATYQQVKNRLAALLRVDPLVVMGRWRRLINAIEAWRRADDGAVDLNRVPENLRDPEKYVAHCDGLIDEAVAAVIDMARETTR